MAQRMEIELTSALPDGSWTWRAAGARQPKGTLDAGLVPSGTAVGAVLRAELESTLEGPIVVALSPVAARSPQGSAERIEILGTSREAGGVQVTYASKGRARREPGERGERGERRDRRGPRGEGRERTGGGGPRGEGRERTGGARTGQERPGERPGARRRAAKPNASTAFRNAALAAIPNEHLPIAEELLRGGLPGVRKALEEQNARARADGRPEVAAAPLLALAEGMLPSLLLASWKDRAAAAVAAGRDVSIRELRSIASSSQAVTLDEDGRSALAAIREQLDLRVAALREAWVRRMTDALEAGRIADALETSARPPEHGTRLSAELAVQLAERASAALSSDTAPDAWLTVLHAVLESPVCRTVKPAGLPADAGEELLAEARKATARVPGLAKLLGIPVPPPPPRRAPLARSSSR